jgi:hypothetical protein
MTTHFLGTTFNSNSQWHIDEVNLIANIKNQINKKYPDDENLLISTTWFGPQFNNSDYYKLPKFYGKIKNLFFVSSVDAVMLNETELNTISIQLGVSKTFYIGNFDTDYQFTFISTLLPKYFCYATSTTLTNIKYLFIAYSRKPREHRIEFAKKIINAGLKNLGILTSGNDNSGIYSNDSLKITIGERPEDFAKEGNWNMDNAFGVPHDIHSLGNMEYWNSHFLNIVGETEFLPWNNLFVTEKTWKPILGLRPFVINGQTKIYKYLRDNGFYTFNHYWPHIKMEELPESEVHDSLISTITFLSKLDNDTLLKMYADMLPALEHNRNRFFEFAAEQHYKINHLFQ